MQVLKLEEEPGLKLFNRSKQPGMPTEAGREIIEQARRILAENKSSARSYRPKKASSPANNNSF